MTKKKQTYKKYWLLPPKIAKSDTQSLGHGLCGSGGSIYNWAPAKIHSLLALTLLHPAGNTSWFEIFGVTNKSATSIQDLFHNAWFWLVDYPRPQLIVYDNGNSDEFKRDFK
jgi:hypothetical protein